MKEKGILQSRPSHSLVENDVLSNEQDDLIIENYGFLYLSSRETAVTFYRQPSGSMF